MQLSGNTILITGGTSGIGLALALKFLSLNNKVIISGRNQQRLEEASCLNPAIQTIKMDLTNPGEIIAASEFIQNQFPDFNILINNAGVQHNYQFTTEPLLNSKIKEEVTTNFTAPCVLTAQLLPLLLKRQNSAIVNVSSGLAMAPKKSAAVYCATKAAIHTFSIALRYQLENTCVKVFEVIPPLVDTPMTTGRGRSKISPSAFAEEFIQKFKNDREEIYIDKAKLLRIINWLAPGIARKIMKNGL